MASYKILWKKSVERDLRKIPKKFVYRIFEVVRELSENPFPGDVRKITGSKNLYRLRVGEYRIIYEVDTENGVITIFHVRHRKDIYKTLR